MPAIGNDVTGTPAYAPVLVLGTNGSVLTPGLRFEGMSGSQTTPLPAFGVWEALRSGTDFTTNSGTFHDDGLMVGFNQCAGSVPCVATGAVWGLSLESDYATETGTDMTTLQHSMEYNFNARTPPREKITFGGTGTSTDVLSITLTGPFTGSPRTVSITATGGQTPTQMATAWVNAFNADSTFTGQLYAFTDTAANAYVATQVGNLNFLTSPNVYTVSVSKSVTGSATETITLTAGDSYAWRTYEMGVDRDRGSNNNGYSNHDFFIGKPKGHLSVSDDTGTSYFVVDSKGNVTINGLSNLVMGGTTPQIAVTNKSYFNLLIGTGQYVYAFRETGEFMFGNGETRIADSGPGILRFASSGSSSPIHTTYYGQVVTIGAGCGTGAALGQSGDANRNWVNDSVGRITIGTSPGSSCTITFAGAWTNGAPVCTVQNETESQPLRPTPSKTALVMTGTFAATDVLSWSCQGYGP
ncbi:hypothetical protein CWS72_11450 [Telmatospirillum siberiense]|uniref:Uncharacterized protein n=1 Tax=Telmatospirillum siberiense TaxID=382514 RepID=A0A2N3PVL2_9PROT|nr:hypothetical protein CWS72_11450 [Telmatospirillum siberiense]